MSPTRKVTRRPRWLSKQAWRMVSTLNAAALTTTKKPIQGFVVDTGEFRFAVCTMIGCQATLDFLQAVSS